ncbi:MAG: cell division/cell wall cluster transcriptional repressor MraZ, partial [Pseudomonadota bacterium]
LMIGYATEMELDGHGRVLMPKELREFAGIERKAMLVGQGRKFELWDEQRWYERCDEFRADDDDELSAELESLSI